MAKISTLIGICGALSDMGEACANDDSNDVEIRSDLVLSTPEYQTRRGTLRDYKAWVVYVKGYSGVLESDTKDEGGGWMVTVNGIVPGSHETLAGAASLLANYIDAKVREAIGSFDIDYETKCVVGDWYLWRILDFKEREYNRYEFFHRIDAERYCSINAESLDKAILSLRN